MMDKERRWGEEDRIREIAFTKTITVFLLLSRVGACLILKILSAAFVRRWWCIKESSAYFESLALILKPKASILIQKLLNKHLIPHDSYFFSMFHCLYTCFILLLICLFYIPYCGNMVIFQERRGGTEMRHADLKLWWR